MYASAYTVQCVNYIQLKAYLKLSIKVGFGTHKRANKVFKVPFLYSLCLSTCSKGEAGTSKGALAFYLPIESVDTPPRAHARSECQGRSGLSICSKYGAKNLQRSFGRCGQSCLVPSIIIVFG